MQLDQPRNIRYQFFRKAQRPQPRPRQLGADDLVVMEGDPAVRQQRPGFRLADVVQQGG